MRNRRRSVGQGSRALWGSCRPGVVPGVLLFHQSELELGSEELNVLLNLTAHWIAGKQSRVEAFPQRRS
jgi:hypothetical protein